MTEPALETQSIVIVFQSFVERTTNRDIAGFLSHGAAGMISLSPIGKRTIWEHTRLVVWCPRGTDRGSILPSVASLYRIDCCQPTFLTSYQRFIIDSIEQLMERHGHFIVVPCVSTSRDHERLCIAQRRRIEGSRCRRRTDPIKRMPLVKCVVVEENSREITRIESDWPLSAMHAGVG